MAELTSHMKELIALAQEHQTPYASLIIGPDDNILAKAPNRVKQDTDATSHAEMNVIRMASNITGNANLAGCHLITTCEPCPMCAAAIYWSGIRRVTYGLSIPEIMEAGHDQLPGRIDEITRADQNGLQISGGLMAAEVRALFG